MKLAPKQQTFIYRCPVDRYNNSIDATHATCYLCEYHDIKISSLKLNLHFSSLRLSLPPRGGSYFWGVEADVLN
jgi:hypothetical protein